jgi:hypothetical protein
MVQFVVSHVRLPGELDVLAFKKIASLPAWDVDLGGRSFLGRGILTEEGRGDEPVGFGLPRGQP